MTIFKKLFFVVLSISARGTETTIYAKPSLEMMRKAVIDDNLENLEEPEWSESEDEIVKMFSLR